MSSAAIEGSAAYYNMTRMGVRTVAKRIAKRTAKGLVKNTVLTGRAGMGILVLVDITQTTAQRQVSPWIADTLACHQMSRQRPGSRLPGRQVGANTYTCAST